MCVREWRVWDNRCLLSNLYGDLLVLYLKTQDEARRTYERRNFFRCVKKQVSFILNNKHKKMNQKE